MSLTSSPLVKFRIQYAFLLLLITAFLFQPVVDPDFYGHLLYGKTMLGSSWSIDVVYQNQFSFTAPLADWVDHEWLFQVLLWSVFWRFGESGLVVFQGLMAMSMAGLLLRLQSRQPVNNLLVIGALLLPLFGIRYGFGLRPQIMTYLGTATAFLLCWSWEDGYSHSLFLFPLLCLVWANMHGGFIVGLLVLFGLTPYMFIYVIDNRREQAIWVGITILSGLITLINPYGIRLWGLVWDASSNAFTRQFIVDWRPLYSRPWLLAVGLALCFQAVAWWSRTPSVRRLFRGLPIIIMGVMAFLSLRNLPLLSVAVASTCHFPRHGLNCSMSDVLPASLSGGASLVLMGLLLFRGFGGLVTPRKLTPSELVDPIVDKQKTQNVFAHYNWSQWLLFQNPHLNVYFDARYDTAYPDQVISNYVRIVRGDLRLLNQSSARWVVSAPWYPLNRRLEQSDAWYRLRATPNGQLWKRRQSKSDS